MIEELKSSKARRIFLWFCAGAFLVAVLFNILINVFLKPICEKPQTAQVGSAQSAPASSSPAAPPCYLIYQHSIELVSIISIQFIAASLTSAFFLKVFSLVKKHEDELEDVRILHQPEQRERHNDAWKETIFWYHDGHVASYVTSTVLPEFRRRSQKDRCGCDIKVAIMDPTDERVCQTYLDYVIGLPRKDGRYRDLDAIKARLCASIYLLVEGYQPHNLGVEIYLKDRIDFIRDDIAEKRAFLTTVGKSVPAIYLINRGNESVYYNLVKQNFLANIKYYKPLPVAEASTKLLRADNNHESDNIKVVLQFLFPNHPLLYDNDSLKRVAEYVRAAKKLRRTSLVGRALKAKL